MSEQQEILERLNQISRQLGELASAVERLRPPVSVAYETSDVDVDPESISSEPARVIPPTAEGVEIVGGKSTDDFPDCCAVGDDHNFNCSGTLISPTVVVTADHCDGITRVFLRGSDVALLSEGEERRVIKQYVHPEVDLRLLVLDRPASTSPRRIARAKDLDGVKTATLVGFGTVDFHGSVGYGRKQRVDVPILTVDCSEATAPKNYGCLPGLEIVAGHRGLGLDSCRGDSGGPLYIQTEESGYALLGATSRGVRHGFTACGDGGVYVRVDLCIGWIETVTGVTISNGDAS